MGKRTNSISSLRFKKPANINIRIVFVVVFGLLGITTLLTTFAINGSGTTVFEAEVTTTTQNTSVVADAAASGGSYLRFGVTAEAPAIVYGSSGTGTGNTSGCTSTVSAGSLQTAINAASSGNIICASSGNYHAGVIGVTKSNITIRAINEVDVLGFNVNADNVTIEGFRITNAGSGYPNDAFYIRGENNSIKFNYINNTKGIDTGIECFRNDCSNNYFGNNTITGIRNYGIIIGGGNSNIVEKNNIYDLVNPTSNGDVDAIRFFGSNHIIRYNYIHDINEFKSVNNPHTDCFQTYTTFASYNPNINPIITENVIIENNYCIRVSRQCLIMQSTDVAGIATVRNVIFRNNVCETFDNQVINLGGTDNVRIENNYLGHGRKFHVIALISSPSGRINSATVIKNNILLRQSTGVTFITTSHTSGHIIAGNVQLTANSPVTRSNGFDSSPSAYSSTYSYDFTDVRNYIDALSNIKDTGQTLTDYSTYDIDANSRIVNNVIDIGPYEFGH